MIHNSAFLFPSFLPHLLPDQGWESYFCVRYWAECHSASLSVARSGTSGLGTSWELVGNAGPSPTPGLLIPSLILKGPQVTHIHCPAWKAQMIWTLESERAESCPHVPCGLLGMSPCETQNRIHSGDFESRDSFPTEGIHILKHLCTP